jgi:15-cis-phytoene synthase
LTPGPTLEPAYAACRAIARREARNFYYAFVALPAPRRNAICAIYAFMRHADDLADDESLPRDQRRRNIDAWQAAWRAAAAGGATADPVFIAVRDAIARFAIPLSLLDELVAGTTMDLTHAPTDSPDTYATFADLYRYCYLVASVVGLVCIRIFGYKDPRAEKLAEETGIAFQLTNILRDVAEDAARNRVYLPLDELAAHGVSVDAILRRGVPQVRGPQQRVLVAGVEVPGSGTWDTTESGPSRSTVGPPTENERSLLASIAARAENYYQSARELLPLIDRESRPALWVLVAIYHALLKRIRRANYDVFSRRVSVPTAHKLAILAAGISKLVWIRATL